MSRLSLIVLFSFVCSQALAKESNADSAAFYLNKAEQFAKTLKAIDADKSFQKAVQFNPNDVAIRISYGTFLMDQRKFFACIEQFGKVLEKDINHELALQKMTDVSFALRRWNDVIIYGNKLLEKGNGMNIKYMLGKAFFETENYGRAKKFLAESLADDPKQLAAVTLFGKVLIELNDYKQAIAIYNKTLLLDPNNKQLIYELGLLYYSMSNYREAARYFELAAEKGYKTDLGYFENLGLACLSFDVKKGVDILNKVLENKPGDADILFQIGQAYFKAEQFGDAAFTYQKVYENDPSNSRALFMTGVSFQKNGDRNKGVALCEKAIKLDPTLAQFKSTQAVY